MSVDILNPEARAEFLAKRMTGIGGSDAAKLCGKSPFGTSHNVYMDKLGLSEPLAMSNRMEAGLRLEPVIADWYADERGATLIESTMLRHPEYGFMIAHPDRFVINGSAAKPAGLLEIKTTDIGFAWMWGEPDSDEIPEAYNLQCQHYMAVSNCQWCDVAVLIGGNDFRIYRVPRNDKLIQALITIEGDFWRDHVLTKTPPEIDGSESAKKMLAAIYPMHVDEEKLADEKVHVFATRFLELRTQIDELEANKLECENEIKNFLELASVLKGPEYRFTWKRTKDSVKTDWKATARELADFYVDPDKMLAETSAKYSEPKPGYRRFTPPRRKAGKSNGKQ